MILILLMIVGLVLGALFLKYFNRIDLAWFGKTSEYYQPFGIIPVAICVLSGALAGGSIFLNQIFNADWNVDTIQAVSAMIIIGAISYSVYESIAKIESVPGKIGKVFFMIVSCLIGGLVGFSGSVVAIILIILYLLILIIGAALSSSSKSSAAAYNKEAEDLNRERNQMLGRDNVSAGEVYDLKRRIDDHNSRSGKDLLG